MSSEGPNPFAAVAATVTASVDHVGKTLRQLQSAAGLHAEHFMQHLEQHNQLRYHRLARPSPFASITSTSTPPPDKQRESGCRSGHKRTKQCRALFGSITAQDRTADIGAAQPSSSQTPLKRAKNFFASIAERVGPSEPAAAQVSASEQPAEQERILISEVSLLAPAVPSGRPCWYAARLCC